MKKTLKLISIATAIIIIFVSTINVSAATVSPYRNGEVVLTHPQKLASYTVTNGIDVSSANGDIDWKTVASSGTVQFAFIKAGATGYANDLFALSNDEKFEQNYIGASSNGIPVGVYWYSQATNENEAKAEANHLLSILNGRAISLPVVFDYEFAGNAGRLYNAYSNGNLTKKSMTNIVKAFCLTIKNSGYTPCIYANKSFLQNQLDAIELQKSYKIWLANYTEKTDYSDYFEYWQYSQKGIVAGISKPVDCNIHYSYDQVSKVKSLYKKPSKTTIKKLTKGKKSFKITYKKISGATAYQICYSTSKKFTKKTTKTITVKGKSSTSKAVKKLKGGKKYYVKVRSYKTTYNNFIFSSWSKTKTVITKK